MSHLVYALMLLALLAPASSSAKGTPRAGAARVDITPAEDAALPMSGYASRIEGFHGIHDRLYVRAIVVDDGDTRAAIVTWDLIFFPEDLWKDYAAGISDATGIPTENILMAATHTHGGLSLGKLAKMDAGSPGALYLEGLREKVIRAVREAQSAQVPARIAFSSGKASVNMNRRARMADGTWWLGNNPDGVSDKTVALIRLENLSGDPIAFVINYAVHGTVMGPKNYEITADLPGATSRIVEQHYGDKVVAAFTAAASGDQDPIYRVVTDFKQRDALARILASEVLRIADQGRATDRMKVAGAQRLIACPGRKLAPGIERHPKDGKYSFVPDDPVEIRVSVLMLNHIAVTAASGEVLTMIGSRVKSESPLRDTIFVTHANGSSGYIPDDAAYDQISYEIVVTGLERGCAEDAIVNNILEMIDEL